MVLPIDQKKETNGSDFIEEKKVLQMLKELSPDLGSVAEVLEKSLKNNAELRENIKIFTNKEATPEERKKARDILTEKNNKKQEEEDNTIETIETEEKTVFKATIRGKTWETLTTEDPKTYNIEYGGEKFQMIIEDKGDGNYLVHPSSGPFAKNVLYEEGADNYKMIILEHNYKGQKGNSDRIFKAPTIIQNTPFRPYMYSENGGWYIIQDLHSGGGDLNSFVELVPMPDNVKELYGGNRRKILDKQQGEQRDRIPTYREGGEEFGKHFIPKSALTAIINDYNEKTGKELIEQAQTASFTQKTDQNGEKFMEVKFDKYGVMLKNEHYEKESGEERTYDKSGNKYPNTPYMPFYVEGEKMFVLINYDTDNKAHRGEKIIDSEIIQALKNDGAEIED